MRKSILTHWTPKSIHYFGFYRQKNNDSIKQNPNKLLMHIKRELILTELAARRYESGGLGQRIKRNIEI